MPTIEKCYVCDECSKPHFNKNEALLCEDSHRSTLTKLRDFVPEGRKHIDVANHYIEGEGWGEPLDPEDDYPFFSEAILYPILGKEDARTVLSLLNHAIRQEHDQN
jgi:hypothetical protein